MARLFGTDGVRGVANRELTAELAFSLGRAVARVLGRQQQSPRFVIGRDPRRSGGMLEAALVAGITSMGGEAMLAGVVPTPAVAFLTRYYQADAGVVISASHNPMQDNGIKFFDHKGFKLPDALEDEIEAAMTDTVPAGDYPVGAAVGVVRTLHDASENYENFLLGLIPERLDGLNIVIDCANGAVSGIAQRVISRLGAHVISIHDAPDGLNINADCGSTHMESLQERVVVQGAHLGLAFDGDADRMLAVDEQGTIIDGDQIMLICALDLKARGRLHEDTLVVTVMSNLGLSIAAARHGIALDVTAVGDRYVLERMREMGHVIGGEQAVHVIFLEHNTTGDGMIAALQLLSVLVRTSAAPSALASCMSVLPQVLKNARVQNQYKHDYLDNPDVRRAIEALECKYGATGRVLIRPSGTEPLVRVMIEGADLQEITRDAQELAKLLESRLG